MSMITDRRKDELCPGAGHDAAARRASFNAEANGGTPGEPHEPCKLPEKRVTKLMETPSVERPTVSTEFGATSGSTER